MEYCTSDSSVLVKQEQWKEHNAYITVDQGPVSRVRLP